MFPGFVVDNSQGYTSIRCDWMNATNAVKASSSTIGTAAHIARCHAAGEQIANGREYNPMERGWCRDQALNPGRDMSDGPYVTLAGPSTKRAASSASSHISSVTPTNAELL